MATYLTTQHPLATIKIDSEKCHPFSDWWTAQWKDPLTPIEIRESLIHVIYDAFDGYIATLLLLDIADGYLHQTGWSLPEDTHHTFSESESEARRTLACKAAKVLFTSKYLRNTQRSFDNHQWLLGWPVLFDKILWFFNDRSRRPMEYSNLPSREDSRKWIREVHDFVPEFCSSFWSVRLCKHNYGDCENICNNNRDYVEQIRPDLFEMILRSGGALHQNHHLLRDRELLQSDACMARFKQLAQCRRINVIGFEFPYFPYASAEEALFMEGSEWAALYLAAVEFRLELTAAAV